jgi:protein TonB
MQEYTQYFVKNFYFYRDYFDEGTQGNLILNFIVDIDGSVTNIQITKSLSREANREVIRVIKKMKKWQPAMNRRKKPVRTIAYLELHFDIEALPKKKYQDYSIPISRIIYGQ